MEHFKHLQNVERKIKCKEFDVDERRPRTTVMILKQTKENSSLVYSTEKITVRHFCGFVFVKFGSFQPWLLSLARNVVSRNKNLSYELLKIMFC